jgi:hypothetical protein
MVGAPTDTNFYIQLAKLFSGFGKPEDFLWIWSSETGFDPSLSGGYRTISTLGKGTVVPGIISQADWDKLPTLSATDQLPFIARYYKWIYDNFLGRPFQDTFEVYLANAGQALLRKDGRYNVGSVMYGSPRDPAGSVWQANWPMDNYPTAVSEASARKVPLSLDLGKTLVNEGKLKGWISLGDLKNFGMRPSHADIANDAINRYHQALLDPAQAQNVPANITVPATYVASGASGGYAPNWAKSFSDPNAPIDSRVANPPSVSAAATLAEMAAFGLGVFLIWRFLK